MEKIASFEVNHNVLMEGVYISRVDGDAITYDIRMKKPNGGDYLSTAAAHTIEHLFATFARNSRYRDSVIYVGPMGCRTGFYLIMRDNVSLKDALLLIKDSFQFIAGFNGAIPGASASECGNYLDHDLSGARREAEKMCRVLEEITEENMRYNK